MRHFHVVVLDIRHKSPCIFDGLRKIPLRLYARTAHGLAVLVACHEQKTPEQLRRAGGDLGDATVPAIVAHLVMGYGVFFHVHFLSRSGELPHLASGRSIIHEPDASSSPHGNGPKSITQMTAPQIYPQDHPDPVQNFSSNIL